MTWNLHLDEFDLIWFTLQVWAIGRDKLMAVLKAPWYTSDTGSMVTGKGGRNDSSNSLNVCSQLIKSCVANYFLESRFSGNMQSCDEGYGSILDKWRKFKVNFEPLASAYCIDT